MQKSRSKKLLKILAIGDVVGRVGREALKLWLPKYVKKNKPDLIVANVENLAHGSGVTEKTLTEMEKIGIMAFTSGNHIWRKPEGVELLNSNPNLLRPANYPIGNPGKGYTIINIGIHQVLIINLMGRTFFKEIVDCPFTAFDHILQKHQGQNFAAVLVDFHAEATSEKMAFGWYADGRASAVVGTHTHIPTADARLLNNGTAFINDLGMVGLKDSILGTDKENIIKGFLTQRPMQHIIPTEGEAVINASEIDIDPISKKAKRIKLLTEYINT